MWKSIKNCLYKWVKCETTWKFNIVSTGQSCWHYKYRTHSHSGSGCCGLITWKDYSYVGNFPLYQRMALIFTDFLPATCTDKNLWISEASLSQLENFQHSSALPNFKYNYAVLFLKEMYWLFIYASKCFLIDHHCKTLDRIYWYSHKWQDFLQDAVVSFLRIVRLLHLST